MADPASIIRNARRQAGLSQAQLASRMGVSQAAIAKFERHGSNPTIATLDNVLTALGQRLVLTTRPQRNIDETLVFEQLKLPPAERLARLEDLHEWGRELTQTAREQTGG
jgi:transcriptional regulator with XRE-family HTH domain